MPFGDPGTSVDVLNTVALTSGTITAITPPTAGAIGAAVPQPGAIGAANNAAGSRLVNNVTPNTVHNFSGVGDVFVVDCSQAVSFALSVACSRSVLGIANASNEFLIQWFDPTFTILLDQTLYEVNGSDSPSAVVNTVINDQCLGPLARVVWFANHDTAPAGTPLANANFTLLSVPSTRLRITEYTAAGPFFPGGADASGYLFRTGSVSLAAGASMAAGPFQCAPSNGQLCINMNGISNTVAGAQFRLRGGFGFASFSNNEFNLFTPAALPLVNSPSDFDQFNCIPARPLWFNVTNVGSQAGTCNVEAWVNPD